MKECAQCGTPNPEEALFCLACGTRFLAASPRRPEEQESSVANLRAAVERMVAQRIADERAGLAPPAGPSPAPPAPPGRPHAVPVSRAPPASRPQAFPASRAPPASRPQAFQPLDGLVQPPGRNDFRLIFMQHDGSDGTSYHMRGDQIDIGRTEGDLLFEDPYLSPRHVRIVSGPEGQILNDLQSQNGVYIRLRAGAQLRDGDFILVGRQVLKFEIVPDYERDLRPATHHNVVQFGTVAALPWGRLRQMGPTGISHDVFHFGQDQIVIGREQGDIVFSDDHFMSRRHAHLSRQGRAVQLDDLGSSNGTFIRLRDEHLLVPGDVIRLGNVLLRFEHV
jgi:pSer/pThr/pTyr-binding forkhead associated (FHA) protein